MFMEITGIDLDLFAQNAGRVGRQIRLRYSWIPLVSIYLIKMQIRHSDKLDLVVHGYHWY